MFFKKDILLHTYLTTEELYAKIESITTSSYKFRYRAKVNKSDNTFQLLQLFDYGNHNQLRPEITGKINDGEEEKRVLNIKFRLPRDMKALLIAALVFNIIVYFILMFTSVLPESTSFLKIWLPICLVGSYSLFLYFFNLKVSQSVEILTHVFKAGIKDNRNGKDIELTDK